MHSQAATARGSTRQREQPPEAATARGSNTLSPDTTPDTITVLRSGTVPGPKPPGHHPLTETSSESLLSDRENASFRCGNSLALSPSRPPTTPRSANAAKRAAGNLDPRTRSPGLPPCLSAAPRARRSGCGGRGRICSAGAGGFCCRGLASTGPGGERRGGRREKGGRKKIPPENDTVLRSGGGRRAAVGRQVHVMPHYLVCARNVPRRHTPQSAICRTSPPSLGTLMKTRTHTHKRHTHKHPHTHTHDTTITPARRQPRVAQRQPSSATHPPHAPQSVPGSLPRSLPRSLWSPPSHG